MKFIFSLLIFLAPGAYAQVTIAFIEMRDRNGKLQQMEPGGRFSHVAISYKNNWLHVHPYRGVEVISQKDLENLGSAITLVPVPELKGITYEQIKEVLGKPPGGLDWSDPDGYYCSKLVGKLLEMYPTPMNFSTQMWQEKIEAKVKLWGSHIQQNQMSLGLSPDDIYGQLKNREYRARLRFIGHPVCSKLLSD